MLASASAATDPCIVQKVEWGLHKSDISRRNVSFYLFLNRFIKKIFVAFSPLFMTTEVLNPFLPRVPFWYHGKQCRPRSDATGPTLFAHMNTNHK